MAEDSDGNLRVGHSERETAIGLLNDAFTNGYLDVVEFEERSGLVYAARTRADLRRAVVELPTAGHLFGDIGADLVATTAGALDSPVEILDADWSTVRRKGKWNVPQRLRLTGSMGTIDLNLSKATLSGGVVDIELQVSASTVKIKLGTDHQVRYSDLAKSGWSTVKDKSGSPGRASGPVIYVRGSISAMTSVVITRG
ncbi:hypothetical protein GOEFS_014_00330 [Gordonia effusa NBRC 100432]|uniref:DUF1707 domain-containing protein n=1 Tax=Gordonia effusa NBRC 100432 TaxID=1077974 RepID=H0QVE0_9ACTN|nr:DUF1707 domain-containing protein [Gordonia effusa]GAB16791.1 hypothetical protein GOEFS_014_00330 [Gordonia effusa NBRC 100432]